VDPLTPLAEAKKKLPIGTTIISKVHPKAKKKPQIRVYFQTKSGKAYIGTLGAKKGSKAGQAEAHLAKIGVKESDFPSGATWIHNVEPDDDTVALAHEVPDAPAKPEKEKEKKSDDTIDGIMQVLGLGLGLKKEPEPEPEPEYDPKLHGPKSDQEYNKQHEFIFNMIDAVGDVTALDPASPDATVPTDQHAEWEAAFGPDWPTTFRLAKVLLNAVKKDPPTHSVFDKKKNDEWAGVAAIVYKNHFIANLSPALLPVADDLFGPHWQARVKAIGRALYMDPPLTFEAPGAKTPEPPLGVKAAWNKFSDEFNAVKSSGGLSANEADAWALTQKYGSDWKRRYGLGQVVLSYGGAGSLLKKAAEHANVDSAMSKKYGAEWQDDVKEIHKQFYGQYPDAPTSLAKTAPEKKAPTAQTAGGGYNAAPLLNISNPPSKAQAATMANVYGKDWEKDWNLALTIKHDGTADGILKKAGESSQAMANITSAYGSGWTAKAVAIHKALYVSAITSPLPQEPATVPAKKKPKKKKPVAADVSLTTKKFYKDFEVIKDAGGISGISGGKKGGMTKKYGKGWKQTYKMVSDILDGNGAGDMLSVSQFGNLNWKYGEGWEKKAVEFHKHIFNQDVADVLDDPSILDKLKPDPQPPVTQPPLPPTPGFSVPPLKQADLVVPSPKDLKPVSGASSLGGAGEKQFYVDKKGNKFLFKLATHKGTKKVEPMRAHAQAAFSTIARVVKPNHPEIKAVKIGGVVGAIYPFLPGGKPVSLSGQSPTDLSPQEIHDIAEEHVVDWLTSQHDSHSKNFLRTSDGRIIGVDKEQGYRFFGKDKLSADYHPNQQENAPFYNQMWKDWAAGKIDYDPTKLAPAIAKATAIPPNDFYRALRPYAQLRFPDSAVEQENFLLAAHNRKNTLKRDFEQFLSGLHEKRHGEKGTFTFSGGWVPESEKDKPYIKKVVHPAVTETAMQALGSIGGNTKAHNTDPSKIVVRISKDSDIGKLKEVLKRFGFEDPPMKTGGYYHLAFVDKKKWEDAGELTTKEWTEEVTVHPTKTVQPHSGVPDYLPSVGVLPRAEPNSEFLGQIDKATKLGWAGTRVTMGGSSVEQHVARVRRKKDSKGVYYEVHFKLRALTHKKIKGGTSEKLSYMEGKYDEKKDMQVDSSTVSTSASGKQWSTEDGEIHLATSKSQFAYWGGVTAKIRTDPSQIQPALKKMLDKMKPGLSADVLRDPTPEEREVSKLSAVLKAVSPQAADLLDEQELAAGGAGKRTVKALKTLLAGKISDEDLAKVEQVQMTPNHSTFVLPGRWRTLGGGTEDNPKIRAVSWEADNPKRVVNMFKSHGALGIHERALIGDSFHGSSAGADVGTGCADNMTVRMWTETQDDKSSYGGYGSMRIIVAPDLLDRLDPWFHPGDAYGCVNPTHGSHGYKFKDRGTVDNAVKYKGGELIVRRAIPREKILRVLVDSEEERKTLIAEFRKAGIEEVNGVPIEDYVVRSGTRKVIYDKYVKPAGF